VIVGGDVCWSDPAVDLVFVSCALPSAAARAEGVAHVERSSLAALERTRPTG
jgi:hypothetical protein